MGNFLNTRRTQVKVLPSGVEIEMMNLIGEHQALITNSDEKKRKTAIDEMLLGCVKRIGDKTHITLTDIERLLSQDRAWALFELRQFSNRRSQNFIFDYEFPVDENGNRRKQRYEVIFDKKDFPQRPYYWVVEKMIDDYKEENKKPSNYTLSIDELNNLWENEYPIMYSSYDEMLSKYKEQEVLLPDSGVKVIWTLLDGEREKKYSQNVNSKKVTSHDQLLQRNPLYISEDYIQGKPMPSLPINVISQDDIETLREDILTKEANIDTTVVVQYKNDINSIVQLNLISLPAFFFPSLAK